MPKPVTETLPASEVTPEPALEKRARRAFSTAYKLRIVQEANACERGELGALLRREKLYHGQLQQWRHEVTAGKVEALSKTTPGPTPKQTPEQRKITVLEQQIVRLKQQLELKDDCLMLQKKALSMLEHHQNVCGV